MDRLRILGSIVARWLKPEPVLPQEAEAADVSTNFVAPPPPPGWLKYVPLAQTVRNVRAIPLPDPPSSSNPEPSVIIPADQSRATVYEQK
jgi:hypothetical protein